MGFPANQKVEHLPSSWKTLWLKNHKDPGEIMGVEGMNSYRGKTAR